MKRERSSGGTTCAVAAHGDWRRLRAGAFALCLVLTIPLTVQAVGISPGHWDVTLSQGDPTPQHQLFGLSFWPDANVSYLLAVDLEISSAAGTLPFDETDLFYSLDSAVTRQTHLEWPVYMTAEELGQPHAIMFLFDVYVHSATMPPNTTDLPYRLMTECLLIENYDPTDSGIHFNAGLLVPINITVEPSTAVVPAPGACLLGSIGLSYAGWRLRRKAT